MKSWNHRVIKRFHWLPTAATAARFKTCERLRQFERISGGRDDGLQDWNVVSLRYATYWPIFF
jgi:hypothetical protein